MLSPTASVLHANLASASWILRTKPCRCVSGYSLPPHLCCPKHVSKSGCVGAARAVGLAALGLGIASAARNVASLRVPEYLFADGVESKALPDVLHELDPDTFPSMSCSRRACRKRRIKVNGASSLCTVRVYPGDCVEWNIPPSVPAVSSEDVPILLEDDDLAVVRKPRGMAMHDVQGEKACRNSFRCTLAQALPLILKPSKSHDALVKPAAVHRLDLKVAGLVICAKTRRAAQALGNAFATRNVQKTYTAIVIGSPEGQNGTITTQEVGTETTESKTSITAWQLLSSSSTSSRRHGTRALSMLRLQPQTGRFHQLRRHCSHVLQCPIVGDMLYNGPLLWRTQLFLCSTQVGFVHPFTDEKLSLSIDVPDEFQMLMNGERP